MTEREKRNGKNCVGKKNYLRARPFRKILTDAMKKNVNRVAHTLAECRNSEFYKMN